MNVYSFLLRYDPEGRLATASGALVSEPRLRIETENQHPAPRRYEIGRELLVVVGEPVAQGRRDDEAVLRRLKNGPDRPSALRDLDGCFLLIFLDRETGALEIANDRFAGLALFHAWDGGRLTASLSFKQLLDLRRAEGTARIDPAAVTQFLHLRRLLGETTYDPGVSYLASASRLMAAPGQAPRIEKYWQPDYAARPPRGRALVSAIAEGLSEAMAAATSDDTRPALLLSGGLDSRALLAASPKPLPCITTALRENNETAVAREVAEAAGASWRFVPRPPDLHEGRLEEAVFLTGGQQVYSETQFLGYGEALAQDGDAFLIGLGLDIFFGGLYLPKDTATLAGRPALHHRLRPLSSDIAGDYMAGVKYRLRTSDPLAVVKPARRKAMQESLRAAVETTLARGRDLGAERYDLWEYLHLHNLSRHYSFPMLASVRTYAAARAPALTARLFDLAIAMTAEQKLDGTAYQDAITLLNPAVMDVRNANTNLPARLSLRRQTATKALRLLGSKVPGGKRLGLTYPRSPGWEERSWPSPKAALAAQPGLMARARALPRSEALADLDLFEMDAVQGVLDDHEAGRHDHAIILNLLLTLDALLAPAEAARSIPRTSEARP